MSCRKGVPQRTKHWGSSGLIEYYYGDFPPKKFYY